MSGLFLFPGPAGRRKRGPLATKSLGDEGVQMMTGYQTLSLVHRIGFRPAFNQSTDKSGDSMQSFACLFLPLYLITIDR